MKILCLSDLHLREDELILAFQQARFSRFISEVIQTVDEASPDAVVLTGDTVPPTMVSQLSDVCRLLFPAQLPAIVTLGNHEFWTRHFQGTLALLEHQKQPNKDVIFLDLVGGVELGGVNFVGGTLFFDGSMRVREDQKVDEWDGWQDWRITDIVPRYKEINRYYTDMIRAKMKPGMPTTLCTHHVPHTKLNGHEPGHYSFYTGMQDFVHELPFDPMFNNYLICGHTHKRVVGEVIPGFMGINVGSDYGQLNTFVIDM